MLLKGQVALVTGGARGIGKAIALKLASLGADIAVIDLANDEMEGVAQEVRSLGRQSTVFRANVANRDEVYAAVAHTEATLGGLDIMINNAGVISNNRLLDVTPEEVDRMIQINLNGVIWGIQAAAKSFEHHQKNGKIINACSISGYRAAGLQAVYSATKFAVRGLTQAAARELGHLGITVTAYSPGPTDTTMWEKIEHEYASLTQSEAGCLQKVLADRTALRRMGTPEDVANIVAFLAGPDASFITGQSIIVDGGLF